MRRLATKPVVLALAAVLLLPACQSTRGSYGTGGSNVAYTPQEQALRRQSETFTQTMVEGALIGAVLGGLIGGLVTGDAKYAAIGAGAGALAGGAAGYYVADMQRDYANEEARIGAMTADVQRDNANLRTYIGTARQVIAADRAKLARLETQVQTQQITRDQARSDLARIRENKGTIEEAIAGLKSRRSEYRTAVAETRRSNPTADVSAMDRQITEMELNIQQLEADLSTLNAALQVSPIG